MKRLMFKVLAATFIFSIGVVSANAQMASYTASATNMASLYLGEENSTNENTTTVNSDVMKEFSKNFPGVNNVIWSMANNQTFGYFEQNGVPVRVTYSKKGKLEYTIKYFDRTNAPSKVTNKVVAAGYSLPVVLVTEIKTRHSVCHLVKMEDEKSIITVLVGSNTDPSVYEEITKG
jgi:hypothetical protein